MRFGETTGVRHTLIRQNGKTIGHETEWLTSTITAPLSQAQITNYQRNLRREANQKDWAELIRDIKQDDLINKRLAKQIEGKEKKIKRVYNKTPNWQSSVSPWIVQWNKDFEFRQLFDNNYLHMRAVARKKNYTVEWIKQLKNEQRKN